MPQLEAKDVTLRFGGVVALDSLSFTAAPDSITALIGPNGAGKTTLFNVVTRLYEPNLGSVLLDGQELLTTKAHDIAQLGIARTFQNLALVPGLTVLDNVMIGEHSSTTGGFLISLAGLQFLGREQAARRRGMELLDRLGLAQYAKSPAAGLPFGTLKRIELARALASNPTTLLLDEPASGLTHSEVDELGGLIRSIRDEFKLTVLLVEHHMGMVMEISDRVVVMEFGRKIAEGDPATVRADPVVIEAYLGGVVTDPLLEVRDLTAAYGPVQVLFGLDLVVNPGEFVVMLGANGAGKTTTLRALSGLVSAHGTMNFDGSSILGDRADQVAKLGIAHVPQGRGTLSELTVEENLAVGAYRRSDNEIDDDVARWFDTFPRLAERRQQTAGSMSGGEQQMLAIARAMMSRPRLILLDEPSLGLAPLITKEVFERLSAINKAEGLAVLLVEQNANLALEVADRAYVLEAGKITDQGTAAHLMASESVQRAYLGV